MSTLPKPCREITILATEAHFKAECEVYAHVAIAQNVTGFNDEVISSIISGQQPNELSREEALAYDVAAATRTPGTRQKLGVSGPHLSFQSSGWACSRATAKFQRIGGNHDGST